MLKHLNVPFYHVNDPFKVTKGLKLSLNCTINNVLEIQMNFNQRLNLTFY